MIAAAGFAEVMEYAAGTLRQPSPQVMVTPTALPTAQTTENRRKAAFPAVTCRRGILTTLSPSSLSQERVRHHKSLPEMVSPDTAAAVVACRHCRMLLTAARPMHTLLPAAPRRSANRSALRSSLFLFLSSRRRAAVFDSLVTRSDAGHAAPHGVCC